MPGHNRQGGRTQYRAIRRRNQGTGIMQLWNNGQVMFYLGFKKRVFTGDSTCNSVMGILPDISRLLVHFLHTCRLTLDPAS